MSADLIEELVLGMDDRSPIPHVNHLKPGGQLPHHADCIPEISIYTSELLASKNNRRSGGQLLFHADSVPEISIYTSEPLASENNRRSGGQLLFHTDGIPEIQHLHI